MSMGRLGKGQSRNSPLFDPSILDTVDSEGRQMKQCRTKYIKNPQKSPFKKTCKSADDYEKKEKIIFISASRL
jgi:hypothetical protein